MYSVNLKIKQVTFQGCLVTEGFFTDKERSPDNNHCYLQKDIFVDNSLAMQELKTIQQLTEVTTSKKLNKQQLVTCTSGYYLMSSKIQFHYPRATNSNCFLS